jgi:hypothetical protein
MVWMLFGCIWSAEVSAVLLGTAVRDLANSNHETGDFDPITHRRQIK